MQPQGTAVLNAQYFQDLTDQVNAINVCADLQNAINDIAATLNAELASVEAQIIALLPIITLPTDLPSVISWITHFATPLIKPYVNYAEQLAQSAIAVANLINAVEAAASRIQNCHVSIPSIVVPIP